eukprot:112065-Pleurochrysis_carterae.AAC.1
MLFATFRVSQVREARTAAGLALTLGLSAPPSLLELPRFESAGCANARTAGGISESLIARAEAKARAVATARDSAESALRDSWKTEPHAVDVHALQRAIDGAYACGLAYPQRNGSGAQAGVESKGKGDKGKAQRSQGRVEGHQPDEGSPFPSQPHMVTTKSKTMSGGEWVASASAWADKVKTDRGSAMAELQASSLMSSAFLDESAVKQKMDEVLKVVSEAKVATDGSHQARLVRNALSNARNRLRAVQDARASSLAKLCKVLHLSEPVGEADGDTLGAPSSEQLLALTFFLDADACASLIDGAKAAGLSVSLLERVQTRWLEPVLTVRRECDRADSCLCGFTQLPLLTPTLAKDNTYYERTCLREWARMGRRWSPRLGRKGSPAAGGAAGGLAVAMA